VKVTSPADTTRELLWISSLMEQKGRDTPKIIIYCPTVNSVDDVYDELMNALDRKAYVDGRKTFKNRMIAKFYAEAGEETKKYIMKKVTKSDSKIRVVVATIAFGLGVNITNVRYVVHWGIPKNHLAYWQEVGRAGRDGKNATAILYVIPRLFSSKLCTHFKADLKSLLGLKTDVSRATLQSKGTQTEECTGLDKLSNLLPQSTLEDTENSTLPCMRRLVLKNLYFKGMSGAEWIWKNAECASDHCPLQDCCSLCKIRCKCDIS
jgi:superfamily II DNA helicase RecQ